MGDTRPNRSRAARNADDLSVGSTCFRFPTINSLLKPSRGSVRRDVQKKLPPYAWKRQPEHAYAAFLSHYKVEAGMEARYLKMELEGIIKEPCFLDSQDLRNL